MRWRAFGLAGCLAVACGGSSEPHRPFPQLGSIDGAVLAPLHLVTIVPSNDAQDAAAFFQFSSGLGHSRWWARVAPEYHLQSADVRANLMGGPITGDVTDHDVFTYINDIVAADPRLARDSHTLYLLYLPAGSHVVSDGTINTDCHLFEAYHAQYGARGDNLAVVQRCFDTFPVENMTVAASHEIIEAATDPDGRGYKLPAIARRSPWTESIWNAFGARGDAEVADLCEGTFWSEDAGVFQRVWSNAAAARGGDPCVPELPEPYYNTAIDQDWYAVAAGGTVTIPMTGWATGGTNSWPVAVFPKGGIPGLGATLDTDRIGAGGTDRLVVTAPADARSGDFAVLDVASERPTATAPGQPHTDGAHLNLVGVYVP